MKTAVADAKSGIAVDGSAGVGHAISRFEEVGPALRTVDGQGAILGLVKAMRKDAHSAHDDADEQSLKNMLFGFMTDERDSSQ